MPSWFSTRSCYVLELDAQCFCSPENTLPLYVISLGWLVAQNLSDNRPVGITDSSSHLQRCNALVRVAGILQTPLGIVGECSRAHAIWISSNWYYSARSLNSLMWLMTHALASQGTSVTRQLAESMPHPPCTGDEVLHEPHRPSLVLDIRITLRAYHDILCASGSHMPSPNRRYTIVVEAKDPLGRGRLRRFQSGNHWHQPTPLGRIVLLADR